MRSFPYFVALCLFVTMGCNDRRGDRGTPPPPPGDGGGVDAPTPPVDAGPFEPLGMEVSIGGSWTINGSAANSSSCNAAGIADVELVFLNGGSEFRYPIFEFRCAQGGFSTEPVAELNRGTYMVKWVGLDADGGFVAESAPLTVDATTLSVGDHVDMPIGSIVLDTGFDPSGTDVSLAFSWTIDGAAPTTASCEAAAVTHFRVMFYATDDTALTFGIPVGMTPCADGAFDSRPMLILADGDYVVSTQGVNGTVAAGATAPMPVTLDSAANDHLDLPPVNLSSEM